MAREGSPHIVGDYWLDKRDDGKAPDIWQVAWYDPAKRRLRYRSTRRSDVAGAKDFIESHLTRIRATGPSDSDDKVSVVAQIVLYFDEHAKHTIGQEKSDSIAPILRVFIGFLMQDAVGIGCTFTQLKPAVWERFVKWRKGPHHYALTWKGKSFDHHSAGVSAATIKKNLKIITAALNYAVDNERANVAPTPSKKLLSSIVPNKRNRVLTDEELGAIFGYCRSDEPMWHFVTLMLATAMRPEAALMLDPIQQLDRLHNLLDLHPIGAPQTKKQNPIVPCIPGLMSMMEGWNKPWISDDDGAVFTSLRVRWRTMRRVLGLDVKVVPKTIRHTVGTRLAMMGIGTEQRSRLMGHVAGNATNEIYTHYDPTQMAPVRDGLIKLWDFTMAAADEWCAKWVVANGPNGKMILVDRANLDSQPDHFTRLTLDQARTPAEREIAAEKRRKQINATRRTRLNKSKQALETLVSV